MRFLVVSGCILCLPLTASAGNIKDTDLIASNTISLDPNTKLTAKGYQLVKDPEQANYWIQAKAIYCHKAAEGVTPETVAKAGAGISSGGTTMASAGDMSGSMMGMGGMDGMPGMSRGGGMPDINAMMRQAMAAGDGFPCMQMQQAPKEEGVMYLCVTDVQITDRRPGKTIGAPVGGQNRSSQKVQQMRMVGPVRQRDLDIPEATPIIQEKVSTGIAGLFSQVIAHVHSDPLRTLC